MDTAETARRIRAAAALTGVLAALAAAGPAGAETGAKLGARGVEGVARRNASRWGEPHPRLIEYASGTLSRALAIVSSGGATGPSDPHGGANPSGDSVVDVVAIWGRFAADVSVPHGARPPRGTVMELVVDAHTGFVEMRSLSDRLPAPLSRLGAVRRLGAGEGGPRRRTSRRGHA